MRQVKGTMIKPVVKGIRADKSGAYDKILSEKTKAFIKQKILDAMWYSFEDYKECCTAYYKVGAKNDPATLIEWGKTYAETLFTTVYKPQVSSENIKTAVEKYQQFHKLGFNFSEILAEFVSDNQVKISIKDHDPQWVEFYYMAMGHLHKFIELSIKKNVTSEIIQKSWEGAESTQFSFTW